MQLTSKTVRELSLPAGKSDHIFWDETITGFGVRLRTSGTKTLIFQYGRAPTRRMKLGAVGAVDFETARKTARDLYHRVQIGEDPAGAKAQARTERERTFEAILRTYVEFKRARLRARSIVEIERHLLVYSRSLHALPLCKIERRQIAALLAKLAQGSGMVTANRVRSSLSAFFSWAIQNGISDSNPVTGTAKEKERARDRVLSPDELRLIWNNLREDDFGAVTKLLLLTACRVNEVALLRWSEIHDDMIVLPPERVKSKRSHIVPLSGPAITILAARRRTDSDLVFGKRRFTSWGKDLLDQTIAKTAGQSLAHWTPHDLRRTAATMMAELGIQPHIIEAVLNHAGHKAGVAGIYNRASYEAEKRTALCHWAEHVTAIIEGRETNVVTLRHG